MLLSAVSLKPRGPLRKQYNTGRQVEFLFISLIESLPQLHLLVDQMPENLKLITEGEDTHEMKTTPELSQLEHKKAPSFFHE